MLILAVDSVSLTSRVQRLQVQEDCPGNLAGWYRHISKGAWPFSSRDHGWPIADCSAEGLKVCNALLTFSHLPQHSYSSSYAVCSWA